MARRGIFVAPFEELADARALAGLAARAEAAGWDGFFLWDHIVWPWHATVADPWVALAVMAMSTERLRLGPMVTPIPRRHPWKLARETVTLDRLSAGRLLLGVGLAAGIGHGAERILEHRTEILAALLASRSDRLGEAGAGIGDARDGRIGIGSSGWAGHGAGSDQTLRMSRVRWIMRRVAPMTLMLAS